MSSLSFARPSSAAFLKSGRILHPFIINFLALCTMWVPLASGQTGPPTFEANMFETTEERYFKGNASVPAGMAWSLERSLFLAPAPARPQSWIPMATGFGNYLAPGYRSMLFDPGNQNLRHQFFTKLQFFPLLPIQPPPNAIGMGPRPQYRFNHVSLRYRASDGHSFAFWRDRLTPSSALLMAEFVPDDLNLGDPAGTGRQPFDAGCRTGAPTDLYPIYLSYTVFPLGTADVVGAPSSLAGENAAVRSFIVAHAAEIEHGVWPPLNSTPPPPPSPVTLDQRSFFRLKTGSPYPADGNNNGIPNTIESEFNYSNTALRHLIISEACFFRTASNATELIGGEAADWVEIWNPTTSTLSTAGYYFSDNSNLTLVSGDRKQFPLPVRNLAPGEYLIIHCTEEGQPRLASSDPLFAITAAIDLNELGEKVYLKQQTGPSTLKVVHSLDPFSGLAANGGPFPTRAIANISYGIQSSTVGSNQYGWFEHPTLAGLNLSPILPTGSGQLIACAEPKIEDATSSLGSPVDLRGRVFRSSSFTARLRHADPAATIVYTLNGTEPTGQSAIYDPANPIVISGTTILRAKAVKSGLLPSSVITRTFFHTPSVASQRAPTFKQGDLSDLLVNPVVASTETAPTPVEEIFDDPAAPDPAPSALIPRANLLAGYAPAGGVLEQLEARPTIAITFPSFGQQYYNGESPDTTTGAPVSVEYIDPANPAAYSQENAYIRIAGQHPVPNDYTHKNSYHLLFKKSINLKGTNRWQTETGAGATTSLVFPGSSVSSFTRLVLRNPSMDDYASVCTWSCGDKVYIRDSWMKENQRAMGGFTARRRWVHVLLNGYYWGLYDLEEHHNTDTISDHLIAAQPGLTTEQKLAYAAKNVLFLDYGIDNTPEPAAEASWNAVMDAATSAIDSVSSYRSVTASVSSGGPTVTVPLAAHGLQTGDLVTVHTGAAIGGISGGNLSSSSRPVTVLSSGIFTYVAVSAATANSTGTLANLSTSPAAPYLAVTNQLDIPSYVDYVATLSLTGKNDHGTRQFRGWRHPVDQRWRLIAWDGDANSFIDGGVVGVPTILETEDKLHPPNPLLPVALDLVPHEILKFHPLYRAAFDNRLRFQLSPSSANPAPGVALSQANIMARYDAVAGDFRRTLECEAMRWGRTYAQDRMKEWRGQVKRFRDGDGSMAGPPGPAPYANGYVRQTRSNLKQIARDARLINDIPPPVITVSGTTATITRTSGTGRIYFQKAASIDDPRAFLIGEPVYTPPYLGTAAPTIVSGDRYISARVYGPDIDGELGWSALAVLDLLNP